MNYYTENTQYFVQGFNVEGETVLNRTISAMDKCTALMLAKKECTFNGKVKWNVKKIDVTPLSTKQNTTLTKDTTMLTKITIQAIATMSKFHRGALLAKSLRVQKGYLLASRAMLACGNNKAAKALLQLWTIERRSYKAALIMQGV